MADATKPRDDLGRFANRDNSQRSWLLNRTTRNALKVQANLNVAMVNAFAEGYLHDLNDAQIRKIKQFDIVDALFECINSQPNPDKWLL
jgi:hypothetical protein